MNKKVDTGMHNNGFTLLITLLLMSVLLGVSSSLLNVVLKQFQLSDISEASEMSFQAANAGIECALYYDFLNYNNPNPNSIFDVSGSAATVPEQNMTCMGILSQDIEPSNNGTIISGEEQRFQFGWGSPLVCTEVSVYKYYNTSGPAPRTILGASATDCQQGSECTVIKSRGYNTSCATIATNLRAVERELIRVY